MYFSLKSTKENLMKNQVFTAMNQYVKSYILKRNYSVIARHYRSAASRSIGGEWPRLPDASLNILFLGSDYQQDSSGMLQALQSLGNVTVFTKEDGSYGLSPSAHITALNAFAVNTKRLLEIIEQMEAIDEPPHLIIGQMWGGTFDASIFDAIRRSNNTIVINIAMDDRHTYWGDMGSRKWMGSYGLIPHVDAVLTAAPECVAWYLKEGCPALFFPEASDPAIFHPMPQLRKVHDVSFVGARYGIREKIIQGLRSAGVSVSAFGNGWGGGRMLAADVPRLFAQSKIVLGMGTIGHCRDFYALKLRDFDGPMSGSFYLTHANPDLGGLYEIGREVETYRDIEECVEKVKWYLKHDDERESIASAGRQRALNDHTWLRRFTDVFASLKTG
jgi:hypothetical protein